MSIDLSDNGNGKISRATWQPLQNHEYQPTFSAWAIYIMEYQNSNMVRRSVVPIVFN